uniref:MAM domain-containing protein n=1 Tax=Seriola dumerili TaxID=41447 RepID=A0A3B4UGA7_SERDU
MLDDISFDNCGEGDVPAGSDQLSCDFENDTCSWYHDYTASLLWERTSGKYNGSPAGKGNSIYVLLLPGSLKFIAKHPGEAETVVWMRSGTQGNKWRFADLTFTSDKPIQVFLLVFSVSVVGGIQGSIAIDDIVVSTTASGSCPPERECTFQGSLCGLQPQPSANFGWSRITGTSQPANSSGPIADHTLGTEQGYYLSAQLWSHPVGSRGAMMTAMMEPTPPDGECLMFWYYMEGSGVGELTIYLQTPGSHRNPQKLWDRSGDQGKHWRHGRVTLLSPDIPYQVGMYLRLAGTNSTVKLDDISMRDGTCSPPGSCDFESGQCSWVNIPKGDEHDWPCCPAESHHDTGQRHLHTTLLLQHEWRGYVLHMHMYVCKLNVLLKEGPRSTTVWWQSGSHGDLWQHGEVTVGGIPQDFTILFEASRTFNMPGHIAIDDIDFTNCTLPGRLPALTGHFTLLTTLYSKLIYIHEIFVGFLLRAPALVSREYVHVQQQCVC